MILKLSLTIYLVLGQVGVVVATSTSEALPITSGPINLVSNITTIPDPRMQKTHPQTRKT